jgi:hypothetical protein
MLFHVKRFSLLLTKVHTFLIILLTYSIYLDFYEFNIDILNEKSEIFPIFLYRGVLDWIQFDI